MDQVRIGSFIREMRKEKGMTQEQFAERLGVSQKSISRWETGKTMPDYSLLPDICEILEINVAELLGAERIAGDSVPKSQVTDVAHTLVSLANSRIGIRNLVKAILAAVLMLVCMAGLYNSEFSIAVDSTADLERAIDSYHFVSHFVNENSADVLERQAVHDRLYVLYRENEDPEVYGLACLQKGVNGKYRILSCNDSNYRWINGTRITIGRTNYYATYCVNDLPDIDAYGLYGVKSELEPGYTIDDLELLYRLDYNGSPFLTIIPIDDGVTIDRYSTRYYQNGIEMDDRDLEDILGIYVEGSFGSTTAIAEPWLIYVLEVIVVLIGTVFIRYFLSGGHAGRREL